MAALRLIRSVLFVAIIAAPLVALHRGGGPLESEKRQRNTLPAFAVAREQYPEKFDAFFRDNFGFRDALIRWHHVLKVKYLRESPVPNVIIGTGGHLFYAGLTDGADIRDFAGQYPISLGAIDSWLATQRQRQREYDKLGARYVILLVPNSQTIYPENVPLRYGPHAPGLFDAVAARARAFPDLDIIDMRETLRRHRDEPVYFFTDAHWNPNGAFYAAQRIVDDVRRSLPAIAPLRREDFDVAKAASPPGDLARMLALTDQYEDETFVFRRRDGRSAKVIEDDPVHAVFTGANPAAPHVMVLGDSFGGELSQRLADVFGRVYYLVSVRAGRDPALIAREHPDVIVLCLVERYLWNLADD